MPSSWLCCHPFRLSIPSLLILLLARKTSTWISVELRVVYTFGKSDVPPITMESVMLSGPWSRPSAYSAYRGSHSTHPALASRGDSESHQTIINNYNGRRSDLPTPSTTRNLALGLLEVSSLQPWASPKTGTRAIIHSIGGDGPGISCRLDPQGFSHLGLSPRSSRLDADLFI
ncbi:hypothetical protein BS47DRAFT_742473 [Hydnum rufescens UP504]|uniref:Uncharacterized protein n=1 Tax=Hydnum rufescens UP504 TaxID=1448309 RepID=A0A9P6B1H2_9AGAM|nr:hypothetical protein BS47DRAFT_742473 [Hydnum rufescens UP504]